MSSKRARTSSPDPSSSSRSPSPEPTPKALRTSRSTNGTGHPLLCTLPPTCNRQPTPIANSKDLEIHYATYHAHVCAEPGCSCVFPDGRLLELHQTECHDPLAAIRKERGEKIFACHLASCGKFFNTPKTRRLHLIHGHGYPKEYFFAVTNKGVGGLLKKWGEGASMIRGEWKKRDEPHQEDDSSEDEAEDNEPRNEQRHEHSVHEDAEEGSDDKDLDALADSMTSLSLIPKTVRFGRGGKGGFVTNETTIRGGGRGRGGKPGRGGSQSKPKNQNGDQPDDSVMDVDVTPARGRGRGSFFPRGRVLRGGMRGAPRGILRGQGQGQ